MKASLESLETRRLLSAAATPVYSSVVPGKIVQATSDITYFIVPTVTAHLTHTRTLMIQGTTGNDKITVLPSEAETKLIIPETSTDPSGVGIQNDITVLGVSGANFNAADVKRIVVDAGAGNDHVLIDSTIKVNTTLLGGKGNDTLIGGGGSDVLSGGDGNDLLYASTTTITDAKGNSTTNGAAPTILNPADYIADKGIDIILTATLATPSTSTIAESSKIADSMDGGPGNDTLYASNGPDTLNGDDGTDTLVIIGRGSAQPPQILFRRGNDQRTFDGLFFSSIESIDVM